MTDDLGNQHRIVVTLSSVDGQAEIAVVFPLLLLELRAVGLQLELLFAVRVNRLAFDVPLQWSLVPKGLILRFKFFLFGQQSVACRADQVFLLNQIWNGRGRVLECRQ